MTDKFLTKNKKKWVDQFKPTAALRGAPLNYNVAIQNRYQRDLVKLINDVISESEKEIKKIFKTDASKEFFAEDASIASIARIKMNKLFDRLMSIVNKKSVTMADRMVRDTNQNSKSCLHVSLKELNGGKSIKTNVNSLDIEQALKASINVNVDLIRTISSNYLEQIKGAVNRSIQNGGSLGDLQSNINKFLNDQARKTRNKAKNVALDQTRKAYSAVNSARMQKVGIDEFEWVHSGGGQEPRKLHISRYPAGLNGGIYNLNDLPVIDKRTGERGLPGQAINCKCVLRPVIRFEKGEIAE